MSPKLHWIADPPISLAHAAAMLTTGHEFVDREAAARLSPIVAKFDTEARSANIDRREFWANIVPWSAGLAPPLAGDLGERLLAALNSVENVRSRNEVELRAGPLRDAWEARGPGLWRALARNVREELSLPAAKVLLVRPVLGGGGTAFADQAAISFEALLANPLRELPEVVRLGWLLSQITPPLSRAGALALVAPLLAAAEEVELARCDLSTCATALTAWRLASEAESRALAPLLLAWWQNFQDWPQTFSEACRAEGFQAIAHFSS